MTTPSNLAREAIEKAEAATEGPWRVGYNVVVGAMDRPGSPRKEKRGRVTPAEKCLCKLGFHRWRPAKVRDGNSTGDGRIARMVKEARG